jgi:hypothetical protein
VSEDRDVRVTLAASRGVWSAITKPELHLGDAARSFGYVARTFEGDAFETAFEWARENVRSGACPTITFYTRPPEHAEYCDRRVGSEFCQCGVGDAGSESFAVPVVGSAVETVRDRWEEVDEVRVDLPDGKHASWPVNR